MKRRVFIKNAWVAVAGCVLTAMPTLAEAFRYEVTEGEPQDLKSFGYYQGLLPDQTRSPSRSDGTYYNMPCIPAEDILAGEDREYEFWHGHGGGKHAFVVTAEDFEALAAGEEIEIFTDVIDGHRHALRISPEETCESERC